MGGWGDWERVHCTPGWIAGPNKRRAAEYVGVSVCVVCVAWVCVWVCECVCVGRGLCDCDNDNLYDNNYIYSVHPRTCKLNSNSKD